MGLVSEVVGNDAGSDGAEPDRRKAMAAFLEQSHCSSRVPLMLYAALADGIVIVHLGFVLFVVLGAALGFRWPKVLWIHLPAAAWGAFVEFSGRLCPLTPLEVWLRHRGGETGYSGGFVEHYLVPLLYPAQLTADLQLALGAVVVVVNAALYGCLWWRHAGGEQP